MPGDRHVLPLRMPSRWHLRGRERQSSAGKRIMNILWEPEATERQAERSRQGRGARLWVSILWVEGRRAT